MDNFLLGVVATLLVEMIILVIPPKTMIVFGAHESFQLCEEKYESCKLAAIPDSWPLAEWIEEQKRKKLTQFGSPYCIVCLSKSLNRWCPQCLEHEE